MAVDYKIEKKDGSISLIMEDKDGSGDLDKMICEVAKREKAKSRADKDLLTPLDPEDENRLDIELEQFDID